MDFNIRTIITLSLLLLNFAPNPCRSATLGKRPLSTAMTYPAPAKLTRNPMKMFCQKERRFSAAFLGPENQQYIFESYKLYVVKGNNVVMYKRKDLFPECPYDIDAMVYSKTTERVYLFKSKRVFIYQYRNRVFDLIENKVMGPEFPNIPESAFTYHGRIYLLKNNFLYMWNERSQTVVPNVVFSTAHFWKDAPQNIDATIESKDGLSVYFWKWHISQMMYYKMDNSGTALKPRTLKSYFSFCNK